MSSKHAFRPVRLTPLEDRVVPSAAVHNVPALVASPTPGVSAAATPTSRLDALRSEVDFLKGMIPHHEMAVRMAQIESRYGSDPQVVGLARRIISEQTPEIHRMQSWLYSGFGIRNFRPQMTADDMKMLGDLGALRGNALDRAFLTDMIMHHQDAIDGNGMMPGARAELGTAIHPSLRQLCANIVTSQSAEIKEMQSLLGPPGGGVMGG